QPEVVAGQQIGRIGIVQPVGDVVAPAAARLGSDCCYWRGAGGVLVGGISVAGEGAARGGTGSRSAGCPLAGVFVGPARAVEVASTALARMVGDVGDHVPCACSPSRDSRQSGVEGSTLAGQHIPGRGALAVGGATATAVERCGGGHVVEVEQIL